MKTTKTTRTSKAATKTTAAAKAAAEKAAEKMTAAAEKVTEAVTEAVEKAPETAANLAEKAEKAVETVSAKKPAAKRTVLKETVYLQYMGKEIDQKTITDKVKAVWTDTLNRKVSEMKTLTLYLKPEENKAYYVINDDVSGSVEL